jgi:hypothetical protein
MISLDNRSDLIADVASIVLALTRLYLLMARLVWFRQRLLLHPADSRPGTVPRMHRGLPVPAALTGTQTNLYRNAL